MNQYECEYPHSSISSIKKYFFVVALFINTSNKSKSFLNQPQIQQHIGEQKEENKLKNEIKTKNRSHILLDMFGLFAFVFKNDERANKSIPS